MAAVNDVLTIVLGGGRGTRLFPLTHHRSKPAVPIGGKYRLIDIALSNCLHADLKKIYVLTQFNSASLNRHIAQTYRLDMFSDGFVEVLAAEQTPEGEQWFQGTADAVRQAARHFRDLDCEYFLILAGDHVYRMDFSELIEAHIERQADITIAAQPVSPDDATQMGIFRFDADGKISGFEEKPKPDRLREIGSSATGALAGRPALARQALHGVDGHLRLLARRALRRAGPQPRRGLRPRDHPAGALDASRALRISIAASGRTSARCRSFYDVNLMLTERDPPFSFFHARRPIYTHARFLPAARVQDCHIDAALIAEGAYLDNCEVERSVVGIRTSIHRGAKVTRSMLLGADYYDDPATDLPLGIGKNAVLDRVIVDKNARIGDGARLVNERGIENADGDGYYIRGGIILVPKNGVVKPGTVV